RYCEQAPAREHDRLAGFGLLYPGIFMHGERHGARRTPRQAGALPRTRQRPRVRRLAVSIHLDGDRLPRFLDQRDRGCNSALRPSLRCKRAQCGRSAELELRTRGENRLFEVLVENAAKDYAADDVDAELREERKLLQTWAQQQNQHDMKEINRVGNSAEIYAEPAEIGLIEKRVRQVGQRNHRRCDRGRDEWEDVTARTAP